MKNFIKDVQLDISLVMGNTRMSIQDVEQLGEGSIIRLNKDCADPIGIYANGKLIAVGETVVIDDNFGVRVLEMIGQEDS